MKVPPRFSKSRVCRRLPSGTRPKGKQGGKAKPRKAQKPLTTNWYSTAGIARVRSDIASKKTWKEVAGTG